MKKKSKVISIFTEFVSANPKQFIVLFLFLLIEGLASVMSMLAIIPIADYFIDPTLLKKSKITIQVILLFQKIEIPINFWTFGTLFVLLIFIKGILEVGVKYAILKIKYAIVGNLFKEALHVFYKSRLDFFISSDNGMILNTLTKELNTIGDTLGHIAMLFAQIIQLFVFLAVPLFLNSTLTLTVLFLSLLVGLPFLLLNKISYRLGKQNIETANRALGILSEILQASRIIIGYGKQRTARSSFIAAFNDHIKVTLYSQTLTVAIPKLFQPLAMMSVIIGIGMALNNNAPISELTAIMWSFLAALPILSAILQGNISIKNFLPSYEQLVTLKKKAKNLEEVEGEAVFYKMLTGIELKDVSFTYQGRDQTLKNINIKLPKGKMVAIVGESGSGKSTIADLILGLQIPQSGEVKIDGLPLSSYNQNSFRNAIGYVPQDPLLFHCSVRQNLQWAKENASDNEVWDSLKLANADNFIKEFPDGLETLVGDRGVRLSGGQRQRIALARALIRKPQLLILDEATSALDSESELLIQSSIENVANDTTILVIAHRLSTIAKADIIYVMHNGEIKEQGTYEFLSNKQGGKFLEMIRSQTANK